MRSSLIAPSALCLVLPLASCSSIPTSPFGPNGEAAYELENAQGVRAVFTNLGATLVSLELPTAEGPVDIVLGFDSTALPPELSEQLAAGLLGHWGGPGVDLVIEREGVLMEVELE